MGGRCFDLGKKKGGGVKRKKGQGPKNVPVSEETLQEGYSMAESGKKRGGLGSQGPTNGGQ